MIEVTLPDAEEEVQALPDLAVTVHTVSIPIVLGTDHVLTDSDPIVHYKMEMGIAVEIYEDKAAAELETQEVEPEIAEPAITSDSHLGNLEQFGNLLPVKHTRSRFEWIIPIATGVLIAIIGVGAGIVIAMVF